MYVRGLKTTKWGFFTLFCSLVEALTRGYPDFPNSFRRCILGSSAHVAGLPRGECPSWHEFEPGNDDKEGPEGEGSERKGVVEGD